MTLRLRRVGTLTGCAALMVLTACSNLDFDLRGGASSTASAARNANTDRPAPDTRGIISYPSYQVAVAKRGDTLRTVSERIGVDVNALASYNGINPDAPLRQNEIIALPTRVAEPAGGPTTANGVDITTLAGSAIDAADGANARPGTLTPAAPGVEPIRHQVQRGETAFTIARLYNVSVRSLADWNGLGADFDVREGQYLLIPVAVADTRTASVEATPLPTELPGTGTPTPLPPSASEPLPEKDTAPASQPVARTAAPDLSGETRKRETRMAFPVKGDIIREYAKGKNDGIDIAAPPGTPVRAAADGTVAAITKDTNGIPIIVVKHEDNLLTVYSNVVKVKVDKDDRIKRGEQLAEIRSDGAAAVHFEVRKGFDSVDPIPFLQ